jgi:VIT1/CCC1 family predicted Fe2+/Mn2+ transporter
MKKVDLSKVSFGVTSAITTSLALIVGLSKTANPKFSIIGALLILAFADNISDSLGIHIYRESQYSKPNCKKINTFTNFLTRFFITLFFALSVFFLPINYAVIFSIIIGIAILSALTYFIALSQKINPYISILKHVSIAVLVMAASFFVSMLIRNFIK